MTTANDNTTARKFIVGRTYQCRSICDYECIYSFVVVARTDKTVSLKNSDGKVTRRKVRSYYDNSEACDPHGRYSMSPVLTADRAI